MRLATWVSGDRLDKSGRLILEERFGRPIRWLEPEDFEVLEQNKVGDLLVRVEIPHFNETILKILN